MSAPDYSWKYCPACSAPMIKDFKVRDQWQCGTRGVDGVLMRSDECQRIESLIKKAAQAENAIEALREIAKRIAVGWFNPKAVMIDVNYVTKEALKGIQ